MLIDEKKFDVAVLPAIRRGGGVRARIADRRVTSAGRIDWYATSKNTVRLPVTNTTTTSCA